MFRVVEVDRAANSEPEAIQNMGKIMVVATSLGPEQLLNGADYFVSRSM